MSKKSNAAVAKPAHAAPALDPLEEESDEEVAASGATPSAAPEIVVLDDEFDFDHVQDDQEGDGNKRDVGGR